jgi:hypothetical protein
MNFENAILGLGALLGVAGLIWIGLGGPHQPLARRSLCIGLALLPTVFCVLLAAHPPGRLGPAEVEGLFTLAPFLLGWMAICFLAWIIGKIRRTWAADALPPLS